VDRSDEGYEILELGHPTEVELRRTGPVLPTLDLGDVTGNSEAPGLAAVRPVPAWRRWVALIAAFVVGVAAGAYGWQVREQAADAARESDLVAGTLIGGPIAGARIQQLGVMLLNNGPHEIEVLSIQPLGWESFPREVTMIGSEEWAPVPMPVTPNCTAPVPASLSAQVRTGGAESTVDVALPPDGGVLDGVYEQACGGDSEVRYGLAPGRVAMLEPADPETFRMRVELRSLPPGVDFEVVEAAASTGGVTGVGTNLPVSFVAVRRSPSSLELTWRVVRCELTSLIGDINLDAHIVQPDGLRYRTTVQLPGQAVAMVARFAAAECAGSAEM
jgi:hypothetical protein